MKKFITAIVIIIVIALIIVNKQPDQNENTSFTIGAVLPLSGPSALWGETVKNGVDIALENLDGITVLYEDSKGVAADGITAFNKFQEQNVDLTLSALSAVSVPLSKLALEKQVPFFVTLVAASSSVIVNDYTTRYYTDPVRYAGPSFTSPISPVNTAKKIAILYRNDELGISVRDELQNLTKRYGKEIIFIDSFKPTESDFTTLISKVKASDAEVLIVPATPGEAIGIVKTANQLRLAIPLVEAGAVFADIGNREQVKGTPFYSTSYDFTLESPEASEFRSKYKAKYGKEPNFGAAFGYDVIKLIDKCKTGGDDVQKCLRSISSNSGIAGTANQVAPGDFVVTMHLEKVN